jgi:hypothetical protein
LTATSKYLKIVNALKKPTAKAEVQFVVNSAEVFQRFTLKFQRQEPLIHVLYDELRDLLLTLVGRTCKAEVHKDFDKTENPFDEENLIAPANIVVGDDVKQIIQGLSALDKLSFRTRARKHYVAAAKHILTKTSLSKIKTQVKHFRCLQPGEISKERSCNSAVKIATTLPMKVSEGMLQDEWKLLQHENVKHEENERIDHFCRKVFKIRNGFDEPKYPTVTTIVKASLALSHGNADVERAFSISGKFLTNDKTAMNARLNIKDGLSHFDNKPELVQITKQLLRAAHQANQNYQLYLQRKSVLISTFF